MARNPRLLALPCGSGMKFKRCCLGPMMCNLLFYWFVGLPLGMWLCFHAGWGAAGLWTGLCCGLILIGSVLLAVWRQTVASL